MKAQISGTTRLKSLELFECFNPIGAGDIYQAVTLKLLHYLMGIGTNFDFSGRQIARDDFSGLRPTPGYTRAKKRASIVGKGLAQFINFASGAMKMSLESGVHLLTQLIIYSVKASVALVERHLN